MVSEWNRNTKKPMIWYLTLLIIINFIFWPPEVIDIWRSKCLQDHLRSKTGIRMESEHKKTYDLKLIHHMTYFIEFILWPPEVSKFWRPPGSSEVKKEYQNGIGTPKNLWFDTSHALFSLILFFDLQR